MTVREKVLACVLALAVMAYAGRYTWQHVRAMARERREADGVITAYAIDSNGGGEPLRLGFIGDSMTSSVTADGPAAVMAGQRIAADLRRPVEVSRYGVPATTTCDWAPPSPLLTAAIERFKARKVQWVCVELGMNDAYLNSSDRGRYAANITAIVKALADAGFGVIVNEPVYSEVMPGMAGRLTEYAAADEELAGKGVIRLGEHEAFAVFRDHPQWIGADHEHPTDEGFHELAGLWAAGIERAVNSERERR